MDTGIKFLFEEVGVNRIEATHLQEQKSGEKKRKKDGVRNEKFGIMKRLI